METDTALNAWASWLAYGIEVLDDSPLEGLVIQLRDSELEKTYPGIYIKEGTVQRIETAGVMDGNAWRIEVNTMLVSVRGDDGEQATSKDSHDEMRGALDAIVNAPAALQWLDTQNGLVWHQILTSAPVTTEESGHRVTTWSNQVVAILN